MNGVYTHGYSEEAIAANISLFQSEGYDYDQSIAMSLEIARRAWRKAHPKGPYPEHLKGIRKPSKSRRRSSSDGSHRRRRQGARRGHRQAELVEMLRRVPPHGAATIDGVHVEGEGHGWRIAGRFHPRWKERQAAAAIVRGSKRAA